jgi:maleylacetate reductase
MFNLPHADTHAVILPYSIAFNRNAVPESVGVLAGALDVADAAGGVYELMRLACRNPSLRALGLSEPDLDRASDAILAAPVSNPAPVTKESIRRLLQDAFGGNPPVA